MFKANYKILFCLLFLFNCSQINEKIIINELKNTSTIDDEYFVYLDTRGWELIKSYNFFRCQKKKFNINIHNIYDNEINKLLKNIFPNLKIKNIRNYNSNNKNFLFKISQEKAFANFDYNGDKLEFNLILNGQIIFFVENKKEFDAKIKAQGSAIKKNFFFCDPRKVAKIAVENAMTKYLDLVNKNIFEAIEILKKNDM